MAFVRVTLDENVTQYVGKVIGKLKDLHKALDAIGEGLVSSTQKRIAKGDFIPNAPLTIRMKRGSNPLRDRGILMQSITKQVGENWVKVGSGLIYARIHQYGGVISAKQAEKLAIPAFGPEQKRLSPRSYLAKLKGQGWHIWATPGAILGRPPRGNVTVLYVRKGSVRIPKREYLKITEEDWKLIKSILCVEVLMQKVAQK
jgi:phage gpG-like protein